jgi:hypothetical protein
MFALRRSLIAGVARATTSPGAVQSVRQTAAAGSAAGSSPANWATQLLSQHDTRTEQRRGFRSTSDKAATDGGGGASINSTISKGKDGVGESNCGWSLCRLGWIGWVGVTDR